MGELFTHAMVFASAFDPALTTGDGSADDPFVDGSDPFGGSSDPLMQSGPGQAFSAIFTIIVIIIVIGIGLAIYRAVKLAQQGKNPLTLDNDIRAAALDTLQAQKVGPGATSADDASGATASADARTPPPTPPSTLTLEERLREVDGLRARGIITESEHAAARAAILAS